MTSLYYAYSKDLKNSGSAFGLGVTEPFPDADQGVLQFRGIVSPTPVASTSVGSVKFTWYVRFHGRTKKAGIVKMPEVPAQTEMSYADL